VITHFLGVHVSNTPRANQLPGSIDFVRHWHNNYAMQESQSASAEVRYVLFSPTIVELWTERSTRRGGVW
jgi:hypothetical protein